MIRKRRNQKEIYTPKNRGGNKLNGQLAQIVRKHIVSLNHLYLVVTCNDHYPLHHDQRLEDLKLTLLNIGGVSV